MLFEELNYTNAVGASGFLLSLIAYCIIRRINAGDLTPSRLYCNARTCLSVGVLKLSIGVFEITYFNTTGGMWWGWMLILFAMFWIIRGNKYRAQAANISAGYQPFNDDGNQSNAAQSSSQRRVSSGPQILIINDGARAAHEAIIHSAIQSAEDRNRVICNAVPPSPFSGNQGTDTYCIIPMAATINYNMSDIDTPRKEMITQGNVATCNEEEEIENETEAHAEDSVYLEEKDIDEEENDDDGKIEVETQTPNGAMISNADEGNVTFS